MTVAEFNLRKRSYLRLKRKELEQQARFVAAIINRYPMQGKGAKPLRVEQLIGWSDEQLADLERERKRRRRSASENT